MPGTASPAINAKVTITAVTIKGDTVASVFSNVTALEFNYFKGNVKIYDSVQGEFVFGLTTMTTTTVTIVGTATSIVIS